MQYPTKGNSFHPQSFFSFSVVVSLLLCMSLNRVLTELTRASVETDLHLYSGVIDSYTMKRAMPWSEQVDVISSDESSSSDSDVDIDYGLDGQQPKNDITIDQPTKEITSEDLLFKRAEMYQDYMKQLPIPTQRGSVIPFTSWVGLGKSIKQLYEQPLHYLTNILLKQWDQLRCGSEDEHRPLDTIIHPCKAEATIWLIEEVHRLTSSHLHLGKLWLSDPMYYVFIDCISSNS